MGVQATGRSVDRKIVPRTIRNVLVKQPESEPDCLHEARHDKFAVHLHQSSGSSSQLSRNHRRHRLLQQTPSGRNGGLPRLNVIIQNLAGGVSGATRGAKAVLGSVSVLLTLIKIHLEPPANLQPGIQITSSRGWLELRRYLQSP